MDPPPLRSLNCVVHVFGLLAGLAPSQRACWLCNFTSWCFCMLTLRGAWLMFRDVEDAFLAEGAVSALRTEYESIRSARVYTMVLWNLFGANMARVAAAIELKSFSASGEPRLSFVSLAARSALFARTLVAL